MSRETGQYDHICVGCRRLFQECEKDIYLMPNDTCVCVRCYPTIGHYYNVMCIYCENQFPIGDVDPNPRIERVCIDCLERKIPLNLLYVCKECECEVLSFPREVRRFNHMVMHNHELKCQNCDENKD